jgi:hypothetical protein
MSRRRYRYVKSDSGEVVPVEVSPDYTGWGEPGARVELMLDGHYEGLRATDGTPIDSRTKHREYMHRHGVTVASDYTQTWAKAAEKRADLFSTGGDHRARRAAVEQAVAKLERRR